MPTNEERRVVAARLRGMADSRYCDSNNALVLASSLLSVTGVDAANGAVIMRRLADLIEPEPVCIANITITAEQIEEIKSDVIKVLEQPERTCRVDRRVPGNPFCSSCGKDWEDDWYYCPQCGAKVVEE